MPSASVALVPIEVALFGSGRGEAGVVVDGSGAVWVDGPWQVTRLDPGTGSAQVWDLTDDVAFGEVRAMVPDRESGVWLAGPDRIRRFDGQGFAADLVVPADYAPVTRLVTAREPLVISTEEGPLAQWTDGQRMQIGPQPVALAVDSTGALCPSAPAGTVPG